MRDMMGGAVVRQGESSRVSLNVMNLQHEGRYKGLIYLLERTDGSQYSWQARGTTVMVAFADEWLSKGRRARHRLQMQGNDKADPMPSRCLKSVIHEIFEDHHWTMETWLSYLRSRGLRRMDVVHAEAAASWRRRP